MIIFELLGVGGAVTPLSLQFTSKVLENYASSQIVKHTEKNNLSEPMQSAYRMKRSTETALACAHDDILRALDDQKAVSLLMLDLSAAFGTVDHEIMLHLRNDFGVTGSAHMWYSSCRVFVTGLFSYTSHLDVGVPVLCTILMLLVESYVVIM